MEPGDQPTPADVRARLAAGMSDENIRIELGISPKELERLKKAVLDEESLDVRHTTAEGHFVKYRLRMHRIADDLIDVCQRAQEARQFTAAVGALKAEANVIDRVIDRGQELGILPRAPKTSANTHTVVGGLVLGTMTDRELSEKLKEQAGDRRRLKGEYGEGALGDLPEPDIYGADDPAGAAVEEEPEPTPAPRAPERRKAR